MKEGEWKVESPVNDSGDDQGNAKKIPAVSPWKTFSKLDEAEKEKIFNSMRAELILAGRMENK